MIDLENCLDTEHSQYYPFKILFYEENQKEQTYLPDSKKYHIFSNQSENLFKYKKFLIHFRTLKTLELKTRIYILMHFTLHESKICAQQLA